MAPLRYPTCLLLSCLSLSLCSTLLYIYYSILYSLLLTIDDIVTLYIYTVYHVIAIFVFFAGYSFIWQTFNLYHPHSTKCRCRSDAALDPQEKKWARRQGWVPAGKRLQRTIEHGPVEIVDLSMNNCDVP